MSLEEYWYPWSPSRYKADTMHLTALQDGIYRRLIDHYMETKSPLPDNDHALARIAGVSIEEFSLHSEIIRAFFTKATAKLQLCLKKCDGILADQAERSASYSNRGKKGGRGRLSTGNRDDKGQFDETEKSHPEKNNKNNGEKATAKLTPDTGQYKTVQDKKDLLSQPSVLKPPLPPKSENEKEGGRAGALKNGGGEGRSLDGRRFSIDAVLSDEGREKAKALCRTLNRDFFHLSRTYDAGINSGKRNPPTNPNTAFPAWISAYTKNEKL